MPKLNLPLNTNNEGIIDEHAEIVRLRRLLESLVLDIETVAEDYNILYTVQSLNSYWNAKNELQANTQ